MTAGDGLAVSVRKVEDLGRRRLARVKLGEWDIFATVERDLPAEGEEVRLAIPPERLFVYVNDERVEGRAA